VFTKCSLSYRKSVIESFFIIDDESSLIEISNSVKYRTLDGFYEKLKETHAEENFEGIPENVQHPMLRYSTKLRPYQVRGVRWMLKKELITEKVPTNFMRMRSKANARQIFYFNPFTCEFLQNNPEQDWIFPHGGVLCDEMGLGKSVEMITLMLTNPRQRGTKREHEEEQEVPSEQIMAKIIPTKKSVIKCPCNKESKRKTSTSLVICSKCFIAQHIKCVFQREITNEDRRDFICCYCWKMEKLIDVKTTIIVSPTAIKKQWENEIKRHVCDKKFKVISYSGISNGYISPKEIGRYDCIITDFNTLNRELYFADIVKRTFRRDKKYEYPQSPLLSVKWWRVILDEAQLVENKSSRPSQMVKLLPARCKSIYSKTTAHRFNYSF
jgi:E3 ubiquitin-protein ligase SHPRH